MITRNQRRYSVEGIDGQIRKRDGLDLYFRDLFSFGRFRVGEGGGLSKEAFGMAGAKGNRRVTSDVLDRIGIAILLDEAIEFGEFVLPRIIAERTAVVLVPRRIVEKFAEFVGFTCATIPTVRLTRQSVYDDPVEGFLTLTANTFHNSIMPC